MEIRSTKQFLAFILTVLAAGAAWLWVCWRGIERIIRGRR